MFVCFLIFDLLFRHPFLLYAHFIERWKKGVNKDDESIIEDNDLDIMFIDDEDNIEEKKKNSNKKQKNKVIFIEFLQIHD
jgi:predicted nucleotidyltransferase